MALDLVIDIGNSFIKGGFFTENQLQEHFAISNEIIPLLKEKLQNKEIRAALVSSVSSKGEQAVTAILEEEKIPFHALDYKDLSIVLEVDEPQELGHDRIANVYGALHHFPANDCIVIDIGTAVTFDYITKHGHYLGGAIFPGFDICAKALENYTDKLPLTKIEKPLSPLAKTTKTHIQSGIYYGLLGAIERMTAELQMTAQSPSSVMLIATGGATDKDGLGDAFLTDLKEIVDRIDTQLTLIGLHEILKEKLK